MSPKDFNRFYQSKHIYPHFNKFITSTIMEEIMSNLPNTLAIVILKCIEEDEDFLSNYTYEVFLNYLEIAIDTKLREKFYFDDASVSQMMTLSIIQIIGFEHVFFIYQYVTTLIRMNSK